MYLGRVVEYGPTPVIINAPQHPYTRALLSAIPEPDPDLTRHRDRLQLRAVDIASLLHVPPGCSFHPRCPLVEAGAVRYAPAGADGHRSPPRGRVPRRRARARPDGGELSGMLSPEVGRHAFRWAIFIVLVAGGLLATLNRVRPSSRSPC